MARSTATIAQARPAPSSAAVSRDRDRFDQHEAEQPRAPGAHRRARRVLLLALQAAREQQAADVGAGDEEQQADGAEQRHQQALTLGVQHGAHRPGGRREPGEPGIGLGDAGRHGRDLGMRVRGRRTRLQPRDDVAGAALDGGLVDGHREPEVDLGVEVVVRLGGGARIGQEAQARRHHADDGERRGHPAERHRLADDPRIAAELALPEVVAEQDRRRRRARLPGRARLARFGGRERPAHEWTNPDDVEEVAGHDHAAERAAAIAAHQEVEGPAIERGPLEAARGAPGQPMPDRRPAVEGLAVDPRRRHEHEPVGLGVGRRREQHALDQPEHRRGRADADGEGGHGHRRERRMGAQLPKCVANVVHRRRPPGQGCVVRAYDEAHPPEVYGAMFWFTWNTLSGSKRRFISTSRA